jgi:hypothetical protein
LEIPTGLPVSEELDLTGRLLHRDMKPEMLQWLISLRPTWCTRADLTFASVAAPERCEKAVRWWIHKVAPGAWAIIGYERQERGSMHAHVIIDEPIDFNRAASLWGGKNGFCRVNQIRSPTAAIRYAVKHAVKGGEIDVYGPGEEKNSYRTGKQKSLGLVYTRLKGKLSGKLRPE